MYSRKEFGFRKDPKKLYIVRQAVGKYRVITPQNLVYDQLGNGSGSLKYMKDRGIQPCNEKSNYDSDSMMCSNMVLGNSKMEENFMKRQMLIR